MSLTDLASIGSFVSGFGVLTSLVFLYFQLRQMTAQVKQTERIQQAAVQQQRSSLIADITMRETDPVLAVVFDAGKTGSAAMSKAEILQFQSYSIARFSLSEDTFYQHRSGLLSEEAYERFVRLFGGAFAWPGVRVIWKRARRAFGPEFVAFGDRLCAEAQAVPLVDVVDHWKADLAAERPPAAAPAQP